MIETYPSLKTHGLSTHLVMTFMIHELDGAELTRIFIVLRPVSSAPPGHQLRSQNFHILCHIFSRTFPRRQQADPIVSKVLLFSGPRSFLLPTTSMVNEPVLVLDLPCRHSIQPSDRWRQIPSPSYETGDLRSIFNEIFGAS